ncbi:MAG: APC family permease, partial [Chthoniobacterales bacterium]
MHRPAQKNLLTPRAIFHLLFGRPLKTSEAQAQKVGPLHGVPILGLDALGSASYGPEAALTVLMPLGAIGLLYVREVIAAILLLLAILYFSYRQTIAAYPNGGGSYTVAKENLGQCAGLVAAASLLLDYVLNVAVGISAGVGALESAFASLQAHRLAICLVVLALVTFVNLRGVRESGLAWALPTYTFTCSLLAIVAIGIWKTWHSGGHPVAVEPPPHFVATTAAASIWLLLRSFASGCTAMTGVEAVSNAVPIFAKPRVDNARRTLTIICALLALLLAGIGYLAHAYRVGALDQTQPGYQSVVSQLASAVSGRGALYYTVIGSVLAVLTLSANTSFAGFPRLCSLLAEDGFLPSGFANLGRRLVYSTGIVILAFLSAVLLIVFEGITDRLIPLFAVGAFGAFTLSQAGMVVHWRSRPKEGTASLVINAVGAITTGAALIVILFAKFVEGAWITVIIVPALVALFSAIRRHYDHVIHELYPPEKLQTWKVRPLRVIIPVEGWNRVTERALRFALRISEDITAVHITEEKSNDALVEVWRTRIEPQARAAGYRLPRLEIIHSPYRQFFDPFLAYIEKAKEQREDELIAVVIPQLVEARWWEYLLHNHLATGL